MVASAASAAASAYKGASVDALSDAAELSGAAEFASRVERSACLRQVESSTRMKSLFKDLCKPCNLLNREAKTKKA